MKFLLDTNVVSELRKRRVDENVLDWASRQHSQDFCVSVMTIFELELGIRRKERREPAQAVILRKWLDDKILPSFAGRILNVDIPIAQTAAMLHVPDPRPDRDSMIAATAITHGLTVVTRNTNDFRPMRVALINPWLPR